MLIARTLFGKLYGHRRQAFTLLEVLLASALILVILVPLVGFLISSYRASARQVVQATLLATAEEVLAFCREKAVAPTANAFFLSGRKMTLIPPTVLVAPDQSTNPDYILMKFPKAALGYSYTLTFDKPPAT